MGSMAHRARFKATWTGMTLAALAVMVAGCSEGPALPKLGDMFLKKDPPLTGKLKRGYTH